MKWWGGVCGVLVGGVCFAVWTGPWFSTRAADHGMLVVCWLAGGSCPSLCSLKTPSAKKKKKIQKRNQTCVRVSRLAVVTRAMQWCSEWTLRRVLHGWMHYGDMLHDVLHDVYMWMCRDVVSSWLFACPSLSPSVCDQRQTLNFNSSSGLVTNSTLSTGELRKSVVEDGCHEGSKEPCSEKPKSAFQL